MTGVLRKRRVQDLDLRGRKVLVRVDFNVPLSDAGEVEDDARIRASLPTVRHVLKEGGMPILASHLGRPKGKPAPKYSLKQVTGCVEKLLGAKVCFAPDCIGPAAQSTVAEATKGSVVLLENLRFHAEEEAGDETFGRALAALADCYVNDAFGTAHRPHASMVWPAKSLPSAAGFLLAAEVEALSGLLADNVPRPFVLLLGGAKVSDKIGVIRHLLRRVDSILIGGAMAYAVMAASGQATGDSYREEGAAELSKSLLAEAKTAGTRIVLPLDHVTVTELTPQAERRVERMISAGRKGVDVGPATVEHFAGILAQARTVLWNGPLGITETEPFAAGTRAIAEALAGHVRAKHRARVVIGGGDTASAVHQFGLADRYAHVSTGGGASLEFLEGRELPGIAALADSTPPDAERPAGLDQS